MKKVFIALLVLMNIITGCSQINSLPYDIEIPLPTNSMDGTQWGFEANKMTGKIDDLVISEGGKKKNYYVGDLINIKGQSYIVKEFLYDEHILEINKLKVIIKLQAKKE